MWFRSSMTAIAVGLQVSVLTYLWYLVCASLRGCFDTNRTCCFGAGLSNASGSPAFHHAEANTEHSGLPAKKKERSQSPGESYIQHQKQALIDRVTLSGLLEEDTVGLGSAITWAALGETAITLLTRTLDIHHKARQAAHQQVCRAGACQ